MARLLNGKEFCFKTEMKHKRIHITKKILFSIKVMYNFKQREKTKLWSFLYFFLMGKLFLKRFFSIIIVGIFTVYNGVSKLLLSFTLG